MGSADPPVTSGFSLTAGIIAALAVAGAALVVAMPLSTLDDPRDGSGVSGDANASIGAGTLAFVGALVILFDERRKAGPRTRVLVFGVGCAVGLAAALLFERAAIVLATSDTHGGSIFRMGDTDSVEAPLAVALLAATAFILATTFARKRSWTRRQLTSHLWIFGTASVGVAGLVFGLWAKVFDSELRGLAEARTNYGTPGLDLVALIVTVAAVALAARRR